MVVKKTNKDFEIIEKNDKKIITIDSKTDDKVIIYDKKLTQNIIDQKFDNKYKKLFKLVIDVTESDDATDTDTDLALMKIEEFKFIVMNNYIKFVGINTINKYLKKLIVLEEKLYLKRVKGKGR